MQSDAAVLDASLLVEFLHRGVPSMQWSAFVAPAHIDAEVLSALARLQRGGVLSAAAVDDMLDALTAFPLQRVELPPLLAGAFALRGAVAVRDSLYVELARQLDLPLLTLDARLSATCEQQSLCAVVSVPGR